MPERDDDVGFDEVTRAFHDLYCRSGRWEKTYFLGTPIIKCPLDLWVYQEIISEQRSRPDVIVETGTMLGGSAHFMAWVLDQVGSDSGRVLTIDNRDLEGRPQHPRISYLTGSSTEQEIVARVRESIEPGERVMVVLDSKHHRDHVLAELRAYAPLVTEGNYLIVEDTNLNSWREFEPGPLEAVREYLAEDESFSIDRSREKFMMTFNPNGYLLKGPAETAPS
jgi:cephalosporin hydroxylase